VFYAVYSLGTIVGSLTAGYLSGVFGDTTTVPFVIAAAIALLATLVVLTPSVRSRPAAAKRAEYGA
jgi:hypothetical protein